MMRNSTADTSVEKVMEYLFGQLPGDAILNVGAGETGQAVPGRFIVNLDHVLPTTRGAGQFAVADGLQLPFRNGVFSAVLLKDVLEHVQEPISLLRELRRVIRPGGVLLLTTPRAIPRAVWGDPTHVRGFTAKALVTALSLAGWEPLATPRRIGSLPGAGRLGLIPKLEIIMRIPGLGHWYGTNYIVRAQPK